MSSCGTSGSLYEGDLGPVHFLTTTDGVPLAYQACGPADAPPVIMLHGYTSSRLVWFGLARRLRAKYRLFLLDCRGCGDSGHNSDPARYNMDQYAADVIAFADYLQVKAFHYVGHSLGGTIGYLLGLRHADRLLSMVLLTPAPARGASFYGQDGHNVERELRLAISRDEYIWMQRRFLHRDAEVEMHPEELIKLCEHTLSVPLAYYDNTWDSLYTFNISADLKRIKTPTLMATAACDSLLTSNLFDYRSLPNACLHVFSRTTHGLPREAPEDVAVVLEDFFTHGVHNPRTDFARCNAISLQAVSKVRQRLTTKL